MRITLQINKANMDAYSNPADLRANWQLTHLGNGDIDSDTIIRSQPDALIVDAVTPVTAELIARLPELKIIHSQGVAFDRIDCQAAQEQGIYVCNNAGVNAAAVAEHTVLLILAALRKLILSQEAVFSGQQIQFKNSCFSNALPELLGKKVGIIGYGAIGRETAKRLNVFGCEVYDSALRRADDESGVKFLEQTELLRQCDIISLHVPVRPTTAGMINESALKSMKPGAILINTARGALIDPLAVRSALETGHLGAYATDTLDPEPVSKDNPLLTLDAGTRERVLFTPHVAGLTVGSFKRTYQNIWRNIALVEDGQRPDSIVNAL